MKPLPQEFAPSSQSTRELKLVVQRVKNHSSSNNKNLTPSQQKAKKLIDRYQQFALKQRQFSNREVVDLIAEFKRNILSIEFDLRSSAKDKNPKKNNFNSNKRKKK